MDNEIEIVKKIQAGDGASFGLLYDFYFDKIYRFIYYKVFSQDIAEDLTSDTFLKALEKIGSFNKEKGSFNSWLYQIARNTVIDYYRTKKDNLPIDDAFDLPVENRTVEQLDALAGLAKIEAYLKQLPARSREIIVLRVWEERSFKEIAELTGNSEASSKMAFSRAIKQLRDECGEHTLLALVMLLPVFALPFKKISYYIDIWPS